MYNHTTADDRGRTIGAAILIGLGVIFLLGELGLNLHFLHNWWAIFIAIPGAVMLNNVYKAYRINNELDSNDFVQLIIGGLLVLMAGGFLLNIRLSFLWDLWPVLLILLGLSMLFGVRRR